MPGLRAITGYPTVIKADGLAGGKGVIIAADESEARAALEELLTERRFDTDRVVVEEFLDGEELSLLALCDGETAVPLASAQDYKRIFDGNEGPNTGGMGSYSPVPAIGADRARELTAQIHQPVLEELGRRGAPFHGVLYAGLMMTAAGPSVLEFNVRFGDPETAGDPAAAGQRSCWSCCLRRPSRAQGSPARASAGATGPRSPWCSRAADTRRRPRAAT